MSYKIPEEKIAEIKDATNIVSLISDYLTLKKRGKNYFGLCPFHHENTPSFSVDPNRQMYHCFGCHKGGNAITFLMETERISFIEAIEFLAERAGIELPKTRDDEALVKEKESLYFVNKFAAEFFYHNLMSNAGKRALSYLKDRGFETNIIRTFGFGYSLPEWDGLIKFARAKSVSLEVLHKAGLIIKKEGGGYYDRFRGRIMTPIINLSKKVVGFGGRILTDDKNSPKYINSPETPIYQKSQLLFGLYQTRDSVRSKNQAIFVEGYTDLISLYQFGIKNVVATLGTALTIAQANLIKRYTEYIILLYDSDTAGSAAAMRGADIFLNAGLEVKIAVLPSDHDPDSYVRTKGAQSLLQILAQPVSLIKFKIDMLSRQYDSKINQNRVKVIQTVLESVALIKDKIKQALMLKEIAEYFKIDERLLLQHLESIKNSRGYDVTIQMKPAPLKKSKYDIAEENIVKILLEENDLIKFVKDNINLEEITNSTMRDILRLILKQFKQQKRVYEEDILSSITDPQMSTIVSELLAIEFSEEVDRIKLLNDSIISIKKRPLDAKLQKISKEIKDIESRGEDVSELMREHQTLTQMVIQLKLKNFVTVEKNT